MRKSETIFKYAIIATMSLVIFLCPVITTEASGENEQLTEERAIVKHETRVNKLPKKEKSTFLKKIKLGSSPLPLDQLAQTNSSNKLYLTFCSLTFYE